MDRLYRLAYWLAFRLLRISWRLRRPATQGAAMAVWHDGRLLVVRCSYRAGLDLPGGGIDPGEPPLDAARRELFEETGITAPAEALEAPAVLRFTADYRRITDTVFAWRPDEPPTPKVDRREIVWAGYLSPSELAGQELSLGLRHYLDRHAAEDRTGGKQKP